MKLRLENASTQPIYRQIVDQLRLQVARGALPGGHRLPSVRELALELRINPNTVARAYSELEREGVVVRQQGRGVFVKEQPQKLPAAQRRRVLEGHLDELLVVAWKLGVGTDELIERLATRASEFFPGDQSKEPAP
ncbi:MAG: GntR family transcriptional regulator [Acidobacteriota bacterium]